MEWEDDNVDGLMTGGILLLKIKAFAALLVLAAAVQVTTTITTKFSTPLLQKMTKKNK